MADHHPLGGHRPRINDRVRFDTIIQVLVLGVAYEKNSDRTGWSATAIRPRRDAWINTRIFATLNSSVWKPMTGQPGWN